MANNKEQYQEISRSSTSEDVPFLDGNGMSGHAYLGRKRSIRQCLSRAVWPAICHLTIMSMYLIAITALFNKYMMGKSCHEPLVYCESLNISREFEDNILTFSIAPAQEAVTFEKVDYDGGLYKTNMYKGPPSPESDQAWTKLVEPTNIRVDKHTLEMINRTALELSDHSGYHAGLGVHHHLHCLVRVLVITFHLMSYRL